jgi:hypothetical protein
MRNYLHASHSIDCQCACGSATSELCPEPFSFSSQQNVCKWIPIADGYFIVHYFEIL